MMMLPSQFQVQHKIFMAVTQLLDFFVKPFPSRNSLKISTETRMDGVHLKTATTRSVGKDDRGADKEVFETIVEPKYEFKECCGLAVELKLQTSNVLSATVSKSDLLTKGFKVSLNGVQEFPSSDVEQTINLAAEYKTDKVFFKVTGGYPLEDRPFPIKGSIIAQPIDKVFVGSKFNFAYTPGQSSGFSIKDLEFKVAGSSGSTKGHITGTLAQKFGLYVNHSLNSSDVLGLQVVGDFAKSKAENAPPSKITVDLAGQHKINRHTTLNGKLNVQPNLVGSQPTGIRFGFGFQQSLNCCHAIAIFGADVNVASLLGKSGGSGHSLGFELKLKD